MEGCQEDGRGWKAARISSPLDSKKAGKGHTKVVLVRLPAPIFEAFEPVVDPAQDVNEVMVHDEIEQPYAVNRRACSWVSEGTTLLLLCFFAKTRVLLRGAIALNNARPEHPTRGTNDAAQRAEAIRKSGPKGEPKVLNQEQRPKSRCCTDASGSQVRWGATMSACGTDGWHQGLVANRD